MRFSTKHWAYSDMPSYLIKRNPLVGSTRADYIKRLIWKDLEKNRSPKPQASK
jgi:hypothetical protein